MFGEDIIRSKSTMLHKEDEINDDHKVRKTMHQKYLQIYLSLIKKYDKQAEIPNTYKY